MVEDYANALVGEAESDMKVDINQLTAILSQRSNVKGINDKERQKIRKGWLKV